MGLLFLNNESKNGNKGAEPQRINICSSLKYLRGYESTGRSHFRMRFFLGILLSVVITILPVRSRHGR
jgi:hypothetical protein